MLVTAQHHLLVMTRTMVRVYGESDRARGRQHALVRRRSGNSAHATAPNGSAMNGTCPPRKSLYDLKVPGMPPAESLVMRDGLRLCSTAASRGGVAETCFGRNRGEWRAVLAS